MQNGLILLFTVSLVFAAEAKPNEMRPESRIVLEGQPATLRLAPHVTTTIYLPDTINSIVVGEPNSFQAEHSPNEPLLVFVKPITSNLSESNLLISTIRGQHFIFLLTTAGSSADRSAPDLLVICKPSGFRFIDETFPTALVSETGRLSGNNAAQPLRAIDFDVPIDLELLELDKLMEHQSHQELPRLHGEGIRVGIGETLER